MKTRGIRDLYMPQKIAFHVKLLLFSGVFALAWAFVFKVENKTQHIIAMVSIMVFELEVFYLVLPGYQKLTKRYTQQFFDTNSIKQVVWINIFSYILFFIFFIALSILGISLYLKISLWARGLDSTDIITIIRGTQIIKVVAIALLLCIPMFLFQKWIETMKKEFKLQEQNLIFQNETLKNQVNPHFLFNSLNTLSSLLNAEVEMAGQFISKLSMIYRYILDNSLKVKVPLKDEIDFIRDYFYMHKIRNEGKISLDIDIKDNGYKYEILPVSLQLLIENAIKHNMATVGKPLKIHLFLENGYIVVANNLQKMATQINSTKIGLKNLNDRVQLLTGKEIIISESQDIFLVKVPLMI